MYLCVVGTGNPWLDPAEVQEKTGIVATESWRRGDPEPQRPYRLRRFDYWAFSPGAGRSADLRDQLASLVAPLSRVWKPFVSVMKSHKPILQFVIHTSAHEPLSFVIDAKTIALLVRLGVTIAYDLYWDCDRLVRGKRCRNCGITVPSPLTELQQHIGGARYAAEFQAHFFAFGIERDQAVALFDPDPDDRWPRIEDNLEAFYIPDLHCLQFASDFTPASEHAPSLSPSRLMARFVNALPAYAKKLPKTGERNVVVNYTERSDFQGSANLDVPPRVLRQLSRIGASLRVHLRFLPDPFVNVSGDCLHCGLNIVRPRPVAKRARR